MKALSGAVLHRLSEHAAYFDDLETSDHQEDKLDAQRLAAIREFANVFNVDLAMPEGISDTQKYHPPERLVEVSYRISPDLLATLAGLAKGQPLVSRYEVLEYLVSLWGYTECAYLRLPNEVSYTINDPLLGFILHAWYALEEEEMD